MQGSEQAGEELSRRVKSRAGGFRAELTSLNARLRCPLDSLSYCDANLPPCTTENCSSAACRSYSASHQDRPALLFCLCLLLHSTSIHHVTGSLALQCIILSIQGA